jgi:hypothetical protein
VTAPVRPKPSILPTSGIRAVTGDRYAGELAPRDKRRHTTHERSHDVGDLNR